jgi:hypothetical protein
MEHHDHQRRRLHSGAIAKELGFNLGTLISAGNRSDRPSPRMRPGGARTRPGERPAAS